MINITMNEDRESGSLSLKVEGHADSAEYGHDLVCAAVSTLTYTLAQAVMVANTEKKLKKRPRIKLEEGASHVIVKPKDGAYAELKHAYYVVGLGYSLLATNYPPFVGITLFGNPIEGNNITNESQA